MIIITNRRDGGLKELIKGIVNPSQKPQYNFGSAHYLFEPNGDIAPAVAKQVEVLLQKASRNPCAKAGFWQKRRLRSIDEVIPELIQAETSLDLSERRVIPWWSSTRDAIGITLNHILQGTNKKVALPIPNWHFWAALGSFDFAPFEAYSGEEFVDNFRKLAGKNIGAVILSFPATPLMYTPSEEQLREIDSIAQYHGINVIIDDVLRGVQPIGQRDTIARFFRRSFIVEGYGKRFGESYNHVSHIITPKDIYFPNNDVTDSFSYGFGALLDHTYRTDSQRAVEGLQRRNEAFDQGLRIYSSGEICIRRPSSSHITSFVEFPSDLRYTSNEVAGIAAENEICVLPLEVFFPEGYSLRRGEKDGVRITVGLMNERDVYEGAKRLGKGLGILRKDGKR